MSDLHLEFESSFRPKNVGSDVLILSGDICVASYFSKSPESPYYYAANQFREFFLHCAQEWDNIIYVPGNHEHYKGYVDETYDVLSIELAAYDNIHLLDGAHVDIDDVRFIGGTLWTDVNCGCPLTENYLRSGLNDYRLVQWSKTYHKLTPSDTAKFHQRTKNLIDIASKDHDKVVVVGHHAPSEHSIHEKYKHERYMNGGYFSNMDGFIYVRPQIKLWTHGHMHDNFDYTIGETRVICNPRGYDDENAGFNPDQIFEI